jgi:hypothetical protein
MAVGEYEDAASTEKIHKFLVLFQALNDVSSIAVHCHEVIGSA